MKKVRIGSLVRRAAVLVLGLGIATTGLSVFATGAGASTVATLFLTASSDYGNYAITSSTGNAYQIGIVTPTANTPTGTVTVTDSRGHSCSSHTPTVYGEYQPGQWAFSYECSITSPESGGMTYSASYSGSDYTMNPATGLQIEPIPTASFTQSGTFLPTQSGNTVIETIGTYTPVAPDNYVIAYDSNYNSCESNVWTNEGTDGAGGNYYQATCTFNAPQGPGVQITAYYLGADYNQNDAPSNSVTGGTAGLSVSGPTTPGVNSNYTVTLDAPIAGYPPAGYITVTNSNANYCTSTGWTDIGPDASDGELYQATCEIAAYDGPGTTVSATYAGSDYQTATSNTLSIPQGTTTLQLLNDATTSGTGNDYTVYFDSLAHDPPTGYATITDSNSNSCNTSTWNYAGSAGGNYFYSANCVVASPETAGETVSATYVGEDYTASTTSPVEILPAAGTLGLTGTPVARQSGNMYYVTADVPTTSIFPSGYATVTDSDGYSCTSNTWTDAGPDASTGELYTTNCSITSPESGGAVVTPSYSGPDYTLISSGNISVPKVAASLTLEGAPVTTATGNVFTIRLDAPISGPPSGAVTVTDSVAGSCSASTWHAAGVDGAGGEYYTTHCVISPERAGGTVSATYAGADYTAAPSAALSVEPASMTIALAGPAAPGSGNLYSLVVTTPTDLAPTGTLTVADSGTGNCTTTTYAPAGSTISGGENFDATCTISSAETSGQTVAANYAGTDYTAAASNQLSIGVPAAITGVTLSGTAILATTLSAAPVGVTGTPTPTISYIWYANGSIISGATGATYVPTSEEVGESITVKITVTNADGLASATSTGVTVTSPTQSTSPLPPTTQTPPAPPVTTPRAPTRHTLILGFSPKRARLTVRDRSRIARWAKGLSRGELVRDVGYAWRHRALARERAKVVALFLERHYKVVVVRHYSTKRSNKEVTSALFN